MILVSGGFGWQGIKAAENLKDLDLSYYDTIITNGITGFCITCFQLKKEKILHQTLKSLKPYLNTLDKDYFFVGNIKNCLKLSSNFGKYKFQLKEDTKLNFPLEIELINLKTEEISTKKINTIQESLFYSTLLPGIRPPFQGWYNTASFSRTPCYSLLKYQGEEIEIYESPYNYHKSSTIQRLYKSIQVMRSRYFYELIMEEIKSKNKVQFKT
ncbi:MULTISPECIES: hypothetical protein [Petrotoga]|uniref:Patatin-like phospholipase n=2 Tax=Petrotoga sibirica TaxID=156202 RepID=A0A4R8EW41_9BACT|nr:MULTISPECIES: hypothetical protein [Petrotoga]POZ88570.1 hypothetical protein AA80_05420 [Petrotoga sibirica DSM 13575]POZ91292.1 hypothetical protein AD60_03295 [Petrotoga sp. SL27]TDX14928.1 hypothetical protein C8D74_10956 [Petrotoga sibirica]